MVRVWHIVPMAVKKKMVHGAKINVGGASYCVTLCGFHFGIQSFPNVEIPAFMSSHP